MRLLRQLALVSALALPAAAAAQVSVAGCGGLLDFFWYLPPPNAARPIALEAFMGTELNTGPSLPLATPGSSWRMGPEMRLSVGLGASGYELLVGAGYLLPGPGSQGTLRALYGVTANYALGRAAVLYFLAAGGVWLTADGRADEWGPGTAYEWRGALGLRVRTGGLGAVDVELGTSTLGLLGEESWPILNLRVGFALGAPPPEPQPPGAPRG